MPSSHSLEPLRGAKPVAQNPSSHSALFVQGHPYGFDSPVHSSPGADVSDKTASVGLAGPPAPPRPSIELESRVPVSSSVRPQAESTKATSRNDDRNPIIRFLLGTPRTNVVSWRWWNKPTLLLGSSWIAPKPGARGHRFAEEGRIPVGLSSSFRRARSCGKSGIHRPVPRSPRGPPGWPRGHPSRWHLVVASFRRREVCRAGRHSPAGLTNGSC